MTVLPAVAVIITTVAFFAAATPAAATEMDRDLRIACEAAGPATCNPRLPVTVLWGPVVVPGQPGAVAAATGVTFNDDGTYTLLRREITIDPDYWARATPNDRCRLVAHEVLHLAGHRHSEGGIMAEDHSGPFPACDDAGLDPVDLVLHDLDHRLSDRGWNVYCDGKTHHSVVRCTADRGRRTVNYKAFVQGDGTYALCRLRTPRPRRRDQFHEPR